MQRIRQFIPVLAGHSPGQLIIQYSDACNATCPQCELRVTNKFKRHKISADDMKRMIDKAAENGVQSLSFTGGEPLLYQKEIIELLRYAVDAGIPYTRTGTNGFMFMNSDKPDWEKKIHTLAEDLANTGIYTFWISLDSADPQVHELMRGLPGVIKGIEKALPIFHQYGLYPAGNLGINRNTGGQCDQRFYDENGHFDRTGFYEFFRHSFQRFYDAIIGMGFTMTNACYPMSVESCVQTDLESIYGASSANDIVSFTAEEKTHLFQALMDAIPEYRSKIRIFSPRCSLYTLQRYYEDGKELGYPCRGGVEYFFVDAQDANTYPCGFRGSDNFGKYWEMDMKQIDRKAFCRKCDWECFRDPSEMLGPLMDILRRPIRFINHIRSDRTLRELWWEDIRYYKACSYFNGRAAPDFEKMAPFSMNGNCRLPENIPLPDIKIPAPVNPERRQMVPTSIQVDSQPDSNAAYQCNCCESRQGKT